MKAGFLLSRQTVVETATCSNASAEGSHSSRPVANFRTKEPIPTIHSAHVTSSNRHVVTKSNAKQEKLLHSLNLCSESDRLKTFTNDWVGLCAPLAKEMAASGWFYLGTLDRTQCFSCGGVLRNWRRLDNPGREHIIHFPHCAMAQGRESRNISADILKQVESEPTNQSFQLSEEQTTHFRLLFPCEYPVTPMMTSTQERLKTFNNHWPFTRATPQMIAEAGFFSLGIRDHVKCFYCNGGLQNWSQMDNAWEEHAKWFPECEFLLRQKGLRYVQCVTTRFPNIKRPILRAPGQDIPPSFMEVSM